MLNKYYCIFIVIVIIILFLIIYCLKRKTSYYSLIINNSQAFPKLSDLGLDSNFNFISVNKNKTMFIEGGKKFNSRYPDIVINKYDFIRALDLLNNEIEEYNNNEPIYDTSAYLNKIIILVRKLFNTDKSIIFKNIDGFPDASESWNNTYNNLTICVAEMNNNITFSLTNIMALPYLSNDCREHAFLTGFLSYVFQQYCCKKFNKDCENEIRIMYTSSYIIYEHTKVIEFDEDHVFVLLINKHKEIFVVDAFYTDNNQKHKVIFDKRKIVEIDKQTYMNYKYDDDFKGSLDNPNIPFLCCGKMYVDNKEKYKIITIPKIYNNTLKFIDTTKYKLNKNNILIYDDIIKFDGYYNKPIFFNKWCKRNKIENNLNNNFEFIIE